MGLIKAAMGAIGGTLADQWLDAVESGPMGDQTVFSAGQTMREGDRRSSNKRGYADVISNGSRVIVQPNQFMVLVDGGRIIDYTAEPGYYTVDNSSAPSMFNGQFGESLKDAWNRFKFGGGQPQKQQVFFINLQEIKGIKFGTPNPVQYYDDFYNAELFLRAFGMYSIKVVDPLLFFAEAIPRSAVSVDIEDINEQYLSEFLTAFQSSLNQMSQDGVRISNVTSKSGELAKYMSDVLDSEWRALRGFVIQSVGVSSITYDEESKELIRMRSQASMLNDPGLRETFVQTSIARGLEAAGSNEGGAGQAYMGMGIGMMGAGGFMNQASNTNYQQMQMQQQQQQQQQMQQQMPQQQMPQQQQGYPQQQQGYSQQPGAPQGQPQQGGGGYAQPGDPQAQQQSAPPQAQQPGGWGCGNCGNQNPESAKFCMNCGSQKPAQAPTACQNCGQAFDGTAPKFCPNCGQPTGQ